MKNEQGLKAKTVHAVLSRITVNETGCLVYTEYRNKKGYGRLRHNGKKTLVHRLIYRAVFGSFNYELQVNHHCDNPACINPAHLYLGTHADNMKDRAERTDVSDAIRRSWITRKEKYGYSGSDKW